MEIREIKGEKIRAVRERLGKSQDDIVKLANKQFTKGALSQWEQGRYKPKTTLIPVLLNVLQCDWLEISEVTLELR
jgi:transcriptional regulator with XRE-family HTH domain